MRRILALLCLVLYTTVSGAVSLKVGADQPEAYLPLLKDKRVALVVNPTSRARGQHLVDFLLSQDVNVVSVMAPEHGFRGQAGAGEHVSDDTDPDTGLPLLSLYGDSKKPSPAMLKNVDTLIFDIQDVGARFYTYISTLHYVMEAAAEQGKAVIVLDRPNPNGRYVDGPVLDPRFQSFVGMHPIPVLHGMTVGELAQMIQGEGWINAAEELNLTVIPVAHYTKKQAYSLPVAPSPNLPNDTAIRLYPSLCFFEATAVSVGRGTAYPFQLIGHDTVALGSFEVTPRSMTSAPHPKLEGKVLLAEDLRQSEVNGLDIALLVQAFEAFREAGEPFFTHPDFMDKLAGTDALRKSVEAGEDAVSIRAGWQKDLDTFRARREPYLLYPVQ